MSFRSDFVTKLNKRYADDISKRRSIEADWAKIRGYATAFMEDIADIADFALARVEENDRELILAVEGHELSFRKVRSGIDVYADGNNLDVFTATTEGYCLNVRDERLHNVLDRYMRLAFADILAEL